MEQKFIILLPPKIPMFKGRPNRNSPINEDDILNLLILLQTEKDLNRFISKI